MVIYQVVELLLLLPMVVVVVVMAVAEVVVMNYGVLQLFIKRILHRCGVHVYYYKRDPK